MRRLGGVLFIPRALVQGVEHLPAGGQGGVDAYGLPEGVDGLRGIEQGNVAVAQLLMQTAVARVVLLQGPQAGQRLLDVPCPGEFMDAVDLPFLRRGLEGSR